MPGRSLTTLIMPRQVRRATTSNGVLDSTSPTIATSVEHVSTYYLGQYDTSTNYKFVGQIADVALYPSALSASQVAANYAAAGFATPTPAPTPIDPPDDPAVVSYESVIQGEGASQFAELDETLGTTATIDFTLFHWHVYRRRCFELLRLVPIVGSTAKLGAHPRWHRSIGIAMPSANWVAGNSFTIETWVKPTLQSKYITIWGADSSRQAYDQFGGEIALAIRWGELPLNGALAKQYLVAG